MMVRKILLASCSLTISGCAFPTQVQRFGVEYNEALASMANQQTMLNILRASKGMPTHFSSTSRFTGTLAMRASGSMNAQLRGSGLTRSGTAGNSMSAATTVSTSAAPTGITTTNTLVTTPGSTASIVEAVAEGVDLYTPQIGGELNSGTVFEVQVFDQQKFYQGILGSVTFDTVETLINQGFEVDLVANLMIARVDLYLKDEKGMKSPDAIASIRNDYRDRLRFQQVMDCTVLDVKENPAQPTVIAPISRLDLGTAAGKNRLTLAELALLDGDKLGLSGTDGMSADGRTDTEVFIVKPGKKSRNPRLADRDCAKIAGASYGKPDAAEARYLGGGKAEVGDFSSGKPMLAERNVVLEVVFRSPEAILRAVGEIVRYSSGERVPRLAVCPKESSAVCTGDKKTYEKLFELVPGRARGALLEANFMGSNYSIPADGIRSMQVISIIQQLVNLQKESSERALSIPVRATP